MIKYCTPSLFLAMAMAMALPAHAATKPEDAKPAAVKAKRAVAKTAAVVNPEPEVLAPVVLSPAQLAIADKVLVGKINCELGAVVTLTPDAQSPGRFALELGHKHFVVEPVVTSTGAVRLEDASKGAVWLQLGNKSMLMDQKEGKRLADECMAPEQLRVAQAMERNPVPGLLDTPKDALVPVGSGGAVQELVPNPGKTASKPKSK